MHTYIALLRGINVSGAGALPMKELAALLQDLGCRNVRTYIQSGNAVFASPEPDSATLAAAIGAEIRARRGFEPKVLLLTRAEFEQAMADWSEVRECHMIRGGGDFLLKVVAKDKEHRDALTMRITATAHVSRVTTLETIRTSKALPGVPVDVDAVDEE